MQPIRILLQTRRHLLRSLKMRPYEWCCGCQCLDSTCYGVSTDGGWVVVPSPDLDPKRRLSMPSNIFIKSHQQYYVYKSTKDFTESEFQMGE